MNKNKIGQKFGKLTLLEELPKIDRGNLGRKQRFFRAKCDCGNIVNVKLELLQTGKRLSCGCLHKLNAVKHRLSTTKEYNIYHRMKSRCYNPNNKDFPIYGGKGINICDRWLESVENFIEDMGMCPEGKHSIDRIDNKLGYFKENCRWADNFEQANNKSNTVFIEWNEEKKSISQWSRELNIGTSLLKYRIKKWGIEKAFNTPVPQNNKIKN